MSCWGRGESHRCHADAISAENQKKEKMINGRGNDGMGLEASPWLPSVLWRQFSFLFLLFLTELRVACHSKTWFIYRVSTLPRPPVWRVETVCGSSHTYMRPGYQEEEEGEPGNSHRALEMALYGVYAAYLNRQLRVTRFKFGNCTSTAPAPPPKSWWTDEAYPYVYAVNITCSRRKTRRCMRWCAY